MMYVGNENLHKTGFRYLGNYLQEQIKSLSSEIENAPAQLNENDYISFLVQKYTIAAISPEWQREFCEHTRKKVSLHPSNPISIIRRGLSSVNNYQQDVLIYSVPCTGNLNLFNMTPSTSMMASLPHFQINDGVISFELYIDECNAFSANQIKQNFEIYKSRIKEHIAYLNQDLTKYNTSLKTVVPNLYNKKKQQIDNISGVLKDIGIPLVSKTEELSHTGIISQSPPPQKSQYCTVAISYGGPDLKQATQLNNFFVEKGVKTWFYPEDSAPGVKLHRMMSDMINEADRIILLCSKNSLHREGVLNEIERTLEREAREGGSDILIPIALDQYVYEEWVPDKKDLATQIRSRNIINWEPEKFDRLLLALELWP